MQRNDGVRRIKLVASLSMAMFVEATPFLLKSLELSSFEQKLRLEVIAHLT